MMMTKQKRGFNGFCLCGAVVFKIRIDEINTIYRCFCSLCRKQSGAVSNAATLVKTNLFNWEKGQQLIQTYKKDTGFTSFFCKLCGSPVPNKLSSDANVMWIPLGLLQENFIPTQELNFCINSKQDWSTAHNQPLCFDELPDRSDFNNYFQLNE